MKQPNFPNPISQTPPPEPEQYQREDTQSKKFPYPKKAKLPNPQQLISHYESQGMDSQEASIKVIEDLQNVLYRVISTNNTKNNKDKLVPETSRKIDAVFNRVAIVDAKLDSKPGYGESIVIGIASGAAFKGIGTVLPHVFQGFSQIWSAVRTVTDKPPSS